jgi:TonB-linked SusC/RagA family outer membrane protein
MQKFDVLLLPRSWRHDCVNQILRVMRVTAFFLFVCFTHVSASVFSQTITLSAKDIPLKKVFAEIKQQTGYVFFYNKSALENTQAVSFSVRNIPLTDLLDIVLKDQPLTYTISQKTVFISRKSGLSPLFTEPVLPADTIHDVNGVVLNEKGQPLQNASIRIIGRNKSAAANESGAFTLTNLTNGKYRIEISFVGYEKYITSIEVTGNAVKVTAVLKQAQSKLDEVQVIAYGTTIQRFNTGGLSSIKSTDIEKQPVTNILAALQGRMPGVLVTSANGIPGSGITMQIRGNNSISALSNPLYIIDGIPIPATSLSNVTTAAGAVSPLNGINPLDVESITVLKDADATAIYGSRGSNGVVLISTKKGKPGKTKFDVNVYSGASVTTRVPEFMDTEQYLNIRKKAFVADNITPTTSNAQDLLLWDQKAYTNFPKLILGNTAPLTNVKTSLSGGNENTRYLLSTGYHHEGAVIYGDNYYNRVDGHINIDHNSTDKRFNLNTSVTYTNDNIKTLASDPYLAIYAPPNFPHYDNNGNLYWIQTNTTAPLTNPWSYLNKVGKTATDNFVTNVSLRYALTPGLIARVNMGFTKMHMSQQVVAPTTAFNPLSTSSTKSSATFGNSSVQTYIVEPQLDYTRKISKGVLNAMAGGTVQSSASQSNSITGINFTSDDLIESISAASTITGKTLTSTQYKYISGFGRINFRWQDKYILNTSFRRDGSSRFGPGKRFGNFWSAGGAWIFSGEQAVEQLAPVLSFGKLRGSYGISGNDQINDYRYLETYTSNDQAYNGNLGLYANNIANPVYRWETNKKLELALELGFLKDRILFTSTFYRSRSDNQLVQTALPAQSGFAYYQANLPALVQNTSWEFELSTTNVATKNFRWQTTFNITIPKNVLVKFPALASSAYASYYEIGQSLNLFRGYHYTGISDSTGVPQFEDRNKDGSLTSSDDYVNIGSLDPKYYGGMGNTFSYKNFSLDLFLQFAKQDGYNVLRAYYFPVGYKVNLPAFLAEDYWESSHPDASRPGLTTSASLPIGSAYVNRLYASTAAYSDASYIRLKTLSFSYQLPLKLVQRIKAQNILLYVQGQNLFTISPYKGLDPEVKNATPVLKTLTGGVKLTF